MVLVSKRSRFLTLTKKADGFSAGVSSNFNESVNAMIDSKVPKFKMFRMTNSYDIRVSFAINKKMMAKNLIFN